MMHDTHAPWWRGKRGEWYVAIQVVLIGLVFFGPRTLPGLRPWSARVIRVLTGVTLMFTGSCLLLAGLVRLGPNLTPLPYPKERATLVQTGPYRVVRHPMYSGGIMLAYGWALAVSGWLTLVFATVLLIFLDIKSEREEQWLIDKFPGYTGYQKRVRKIIPLIY